MKQPTPLARAVSAALDLNPSTLRALAREAGVTHSLLIRAQYGQVSEGTAEAVRRALERWGRNCMRAANLITQAGV